MTKPRARVTVEDVEEIRNLYNQGIPIPEIGKMIDRHPTTVKYWIRNKTFIPSVTQRDVDMKEKKRLKKQRETSDYYKLLYEQDNKKFVRSKEDGRLLRTMKLDRRLDK
jgi:IS30 family transposase